MMIERLEIRRLLAVVAPGPGVRYDADTMKVHVTGTAGNDVITVVRRDNRLIVTLNGAKHTFDRTTVTRVDALGAGGEDIIDAQHTSIPLEAFGGGGRDTIIGGWGDDMLFGQDQPDRLIGLAGNDSIDGGGGHDAVFGGDGADQLSGGTFSDRVFGDAGNDEIADYDGKDVVDGGADADWLTRWDLDNDDELAHVSIEGESLMHLEKHADPRIRLQAIRRKDGQFAVVVAATHSSGGYTRHFGELTRNKRTFYADVRGEGTGSGIAAIITEQRTYILGRLADGTYTFNAGNADRHLASITIQIESGRLTNTWTTPTPQTPTIAGIAT
jgi:Ca2+-binding RTX toxin-like protein